MSDGAIKSVSESKTSVERFSKRRRSNSSPEEIDSKKMPRSLDVVDDKLLNRISEMLDSKLATFKNDFKVIEEKLEIIISDNKNLKAEIVHLKEENKEIKRNLEFLLRKSKSKNLIGGLEEISVTENKITAVQDFLNRALGVNDLMIDRILPIGRNKSILVEFLKISDVQLVLRNAKKLRGTGIWINRDLSYQDRQKRKNLLEVKKRILDKDKEAKVLNLRKIYVKYLPSVIIIYLYLLYIYQNAF
ncbi:uncharacterized protein isoform X2 [Rhodnius prolixus]|uniref:uncharacterized protein isoform X2 n=1 Tax=Rhodnius prolixus TaxID=13249 RepID=UPI003D188035